jgi:hypothetical protein
MRNSTNPLLSSRSLIYLDRWQNRRMLPRKNPKMLSPVLDAVSRTFAVIQSWFSKYRSRRLEQDR